LRASDLTMRRYAPDGDSSSDFPCCRAVRLGQPAESTEPNRWKDDGSAL